MLRINSMKKEWEQVFEVIRYFINGGEKKLFEKYREYQPVKDLSEKVDILSHENLNNILIGIIER